MLTSTILWLLTYLLHSTLLIGGVWLVTRFARRRMRLAAQEALWKAALLAGVVTASIQTAVVDVSPWAPLEVPLAASPMSGSHELSSGMDSSAKADRASAGQPVRELRRVVVVRSSDVARRVVVATEPTRKLPRARLPDGVATTTNEPVPAVTETEPEAEPRTGWGFAALVALLIGSFVGLVRIAASAWRLRKRLACRRDVLEDPTLELFLRLQDKAGIRRVRLTAARSLPAPIALCRREVVVPERVMDELEPSLQEAMLAHELAHVVRRDALWAWVTAIIGAALFFQPLNRVAKRKLAEVAEMQCDDWAVALLGRGTTLASCLATVASWNVESTPHLPIAAMDGGTVSDRVKRLLDNRLRRSNGRLATTTLASMGALALAAGLVVPGIVQAGLVAGTRESEADAESRRAESVEDDEVGSFAQAPLALPEPPKPPKPPKAQEPPEPPKAPDPPQAPDPPAPPAPPTKSGFVFEFHGDDEELRGHVRIVVPELEGGVDVDIDGEHLDIDGALTFLDEESAEHIARKVERAMQRAARAWEQRFDDLERELGDLPGFDAPAFERSAERWREYAEASKRSSQQAAREVERNFETEFRREWERFQRSRRGRSAEELAQDFLEHWNRQQRSSSERERERAEQRTERADRRARERARRQHERRIERLERALEREKRRLERMNEQARDVDETAVTPTVYTL